jgi:hypothetical protein
MNETNYIYKIFWGWNPLFGSLALLAIMIGIVGWGFPDMYFIIEMTAAALMLALFFITIK